jgi:hypothetical protein
MITASILICGAGIVGLTVARDLVAAGYDDILIIDKEPEAGRHASGRNSGVLHAGVYYAPGSLRAQSCLEGNFRMKQYCEERNLPLLKTGKVMWRATSPSCPPCGSFMPAPPRTGPRSTSSTTSSWPRSSPTPRAPGRHCSRTTPPWWTPRRYCGASSRSCSTPARCASSLARASSAWAARGCAALADHERHSRFFLNAAGAYSDVVAHAFGLGQDYRLIPFKGIYKKLKAKKAHTIRGSIYPVPNIKNPFLGVHFTRGVHGDVYLGPTAIPALGRENYGILAGIDAEACHPAARRSFFAQQEVPRHRAGGAAQFFNIFNDAGNW